MRCANARLHLLVFFMNTFHLLLGLNLALLYIMKFKNLHRKALKYCSSATLCGRL